MWEDLYHKISKTGLTPSLVVNNGNILGIDVYSPALQLDARVNILKEVCGDDFLFHQFPNQEIISITPKITNHVTSHVRNHSATT